MKKKNPPQNNSVLYNISLHIHVFSHPHTGLCQMLAEHKNLVMSFRSCASRTRVLTLPKHWAHPSSDKGLSHCD